MELVGILERAIMANETTFIADGGNRWHVVFEGNTFQHPLVGWFLIRTNLSPVYLDKQGKLCDLISGPSTSKWKLIR